MQAASLFDGFSFDLFPPIENGLTAPEVDVSPRQVVQALVVSTVVVVPDELLDALFELSWQVVVVQQDPVFHRAMISLDLALRHRVIGFAACMTHALFVEPVGKFARHIGRTVVAEQPRMLIERNLVEAGCLQRQLKCCGHIRGRHGGTELVGHDVAREVVEHGREIVPSPTGDLEVGEVRLPELVDGGGLVPEPSPP